MAKRSRRRVKTGKFYLRKEQDTDGTNFNQGELDVSSFVNPLQGEVINVTRVWFEWTSDNGGSIQGADIGVNTGASAMATLSSESATAIKGFTSNALFAKNQIYAHTTASKIDFMTQDDGLNPYEWDEGYLIATDAIYMGVDQNDVDSFANNIRCSAILECEVVKLSIEDAQAVLVSQTLG